MKELFGIPIGPLSAVLTVLLALLVGAVGGLALRNRVFFKLGIRNVRRRRARTSLIVLGLMLGTTIVASALASGDTMSNTIRSSAVESLGNTDVLVSAKGADVDVTVPLGQATGVDYVPEVVLTRITGKLLESNHFDGVAPAIVEAVAVQDVTSRQSEPRVTLFASDGPALAAFGEIRSTRGTVLRLDELIFNEVYLNADAADELGARVGDNLRLYGPNQPARVRVRDIVEFQGAGTDGPAVLVGLHAAQEFLGRQGEVKHVLISAVGGPTNGVRYTDEITSVLAPRLAELGLEADPVKRDALEAADAEGNAYMSIFTTFGSFSIAAGFMLIFLIFVMLAAERRGELGIARAIGTRRGHLVQMYVYEGLAYDLIAAAVGALAGVAVAFGMVFVIASALGTQGIEVRHDVQPRSILVAYALGVLLTFVVVTISAWRVSRLNIVAAVRNLPEPSSHRARRGWIGGLLAVGVGALMVLSGISGGDALPFMLGGSLVLIGAVPVACVLRIPERVAFTAAGLGVVVFCLLPFAWLDALAGTDLKMSFSVWIASGLLVVMGAAWVIVYNADLLLAAVMAVGGRFRSVAPVLKLAIAYPLRAKFRTGTTLAMFTLVVFTLVAGATISGSFIHSFSNTAEFSGGFDVRGDVAAVSPIADPKAALANARGLDASDFGVIGRQSYLPVEARQLGASGDTFEDYPVRGLDEAFLRHTTYEFAAKARGYPDPWKALAARPGLAIVDGLVAPRRDDWGAGYVPPEFQLRGFFVEDGTFNPVPIAVRDPQTGRSMRLTVIGVLQDFVPLSMIGISTSQTSLEGTFGARVEPTAYYFDLAAGLDARTVATQLESAFLANGLEAEALEEVLDDAIDTQVTFNRIVEGFMGLGLVVGVAALGVISARAVVERRQQIGIMRAIGFRRGMIQLSFLLESSFVALTAIAVGTLLGLIVSWNVIGDISGTASFENLAVHVPWANLTVIFLTVYAVALLTTLAPAVRASRVQPAEALRYE
jgi:putative ABC transport system permease protein